MKAFSSLTRASAALIAAGLGVVACMDVKPPMAPSQLAPVPVRLEITSREAAVGTRVAVAVRVDERIGGLQGSLRFDPSRLSYVGQAADVKSITLINTKQANEGSLRFASFHSGGIQDRVAQFVFEVRGAGYADAVAYINEMAATAGPNASRLNVTVISQAMVNRSYAVPGDARRMSVKDWAAMIDPAVSADAPINARPGEYRLNLKYGDVDFDNAIGLVDYLAVANAAIGSDQIIVGTDDPANDKDMAIAANVAPLTGGNCGSEPDGSRALDLLDYLAIANEAVGSNEACVGDVIPGRGPLVSTVQSITAASVPSLTIANGQTVTLTNDKIWQLEGILRVQDGGILNVQAGTRVQGNSALALTAIFVERGGRINAIGTPAQPVIFSCSAEPKTKGCWGGIFLAGKSSVNLDDPTAARYAGAMVCDPGVSNFARHGEGNAPDYGGCVRGDNSGTIQYAVIEYGGQNVTADNELNNLTLGGVGSGTTLDHLQIHGGRDDGVEFFGGSVNVKYILLTGNDDDQFDISFGWNGDAQFVITQADAGGLSPTLAPDSKAIEADNNEPAPGTLAQPRTSPKLFNFTMIGNLAIRAEGPQPAAIHLRRGTGPSINNSLVVGFPIGLDIDDGITCDNTVGTPPSIKSTTWIDVPDLGNGDGSDPVGTGVCPAGSATEMEEAFLAAQPGFRTRAGIANVLVDALSTNLPDWSMKLVAGLPAEGGVEPLPAGDPFFTAANYRGAVAPTGSGSIPWYSGWTRPWQGATTP